MQNFAFPARAPRAILRRIFSAAVNIERRPSMFFSWRNTQSPAKLTFAITPGLLHPRGKMHIKHTCANTIRLPVDEAWSRHFLGGNDLPLTLSNLGIEFSFVRNTLSIRFRFVIFHILRRGIILGKPLALWLSAVGRISFLNGKQSKKEKKQYSKLSNPWLNLSRSVLSKCCCCF